MVLGAVAHAGITFGRPFLCMARRTCNDTPHTCPGGGISWGPIALKTVGKLHLPRPCFRSWQCAPLSIQVAHFNPRMDCCEGLATCVLFGRASQRFAEPPRTSSPSFSRLSLFGCSWVVRLRLRTAALNVKSHEYSPQWLFPHRWQYVACLRGSHVFGLTLPSLTSLHA